MSSLLIVTSIVYALLCLAPAAMKLSGTAKMRATAEHFGVPWSRYRAIGLLELAAAAGIIAGIYWRPIGLAAALGMVALLIGALIFHRRAGDTISEYAAALVFLAASVVYIAVWVAT